MKALACLLCVLAFAVGPAWSASHEAAPQPSAPQSQADKWGFQTLPDASDNAPLTQANEDAANVQAIVSDRKADRTFKQNALIALSCTTLLVYLVAVALMYKLPSQLRGGQLVHLTSLALIVYGSLVLALVPTTHEGLTAPIGILGALAGYLFGHSSLSNDKDKDNKAGHG